MPIGVPGMLSVNSILNVIMVISILMKVLGWDTKKTILFFIGYLVTFYTSDYGHMQTMHHHSWKISWYEKLIDYFTHFLPWFYLQCTLPIVLVVAMFKRTVFWAGQEYYLNFGGKVEPIVEGRKNTNCLVGCLHYFE